MKRLVLVLVVLFFSFGQTLSMYFWQDDSALMFKLQHPAGPAGSFGSGLFERGAYQYLVVPFVPFFPLFKLNPFGYFLIGFISYGLATLAFYYFVRVLTSNPTLSYFCTLIFAAGYISSDTMFRIINSWQTNIGLIMALLTLSFYTKFLQRTGLKWYLLALLFYLGTIELVFIRSHSLIFIIFSLHIVLRFWGTIKKEFIPFILAQLPFWLLFKLWYLQSSGFGSQGLHSLFSQLFTQGKFNELTPLFANLGNLYIPDTLQSHFITLTHHPALLVALGIITIFSLLFYLTHHARVIVALPAAAGIILVLNNLFIGLNDYWYRDPQAHLAGFIGLLFSVLILLTAYLLAKQSQAFSRVLVVGLLITASQIFGYYLQYPTAIFGTTHRYYSHSFIGYSLVLGALSYLFYSHLPMRSVRAIAGLTFVLVTNLLLSYIYQSRLVATRSKPTRNFYSSLTTAVPTANKDDIFYFDVSEFDNSPATFRDFFSVGSMPESTALAIYYNLDRYDFTLFTEPDELLSYLVAHPSGRQGLHSFFYSSRSPLTDTTPIMRTGLSSTSAPLALVADDSISGHLLLHPTVSSVLPLNLTFNFTAKPLLSASPTPPTLVSRLHLASYLTNRLNYYSTVQATSSSQWKYQELPQAVDNNPATSWRGHRIWWHDNHHEQLVLTLQKTISIGSLVWTNWNHTLTPTAYSISLSADNQTWTTVKQITQGPERRDGEQITESFPPFAARYVKFDITQTLSDDAPAFSEIEIVPAIYSDVTLNQVDQFLRSPLQGVTPELLPQLEPLVQAQLVVTTDKNIRTYYFPINLFNQSVHHDLVLAPGGTTIKTIDISMPSVPAKLSADSFSIQPLNLDQIVSRHLIKNFSVN